MSSEFQSLGSPEGTGAPSHPDVRELARDIDFAIDVTEPREVLLRRFEDLINVYAIKFRVRTVAETIGSLHRSGWLTEEAATHILATLPLTGAPVRVEE